uniref:ATP synthase complex subunit 8 n=1 Tax=Calyptocephalella gayi TaxID=655848 RepID=K9JZN9_CALGY|nr:ATP synthase F0 subunit 8 [Calyptocephallela gayi]
MPQLNPNPWLMILLFSWVILTTLALTKITNFKDLNDPSAKPFKGPNTPWTWPWP